MKSFTDSSIISCIEPTNNIQRNTNQFNPQTMSYLGWSVEDWKKFHYESTPDESFELLSQLLKSQKAAPEDPAWISLASIEIWNTNGNFTIKIE